MKRFGTLVVACSLAAMMLFTTAGIANAAPVATNPNAIDITGTATNAAGQTVNFVGTFDINRFIARNGQLAAVGTLTGTLTNTVTGAVRDITRQIVVPLQANGPCPILHLTLGPLDLNLLGLMVHLDRVVLDITAQPGPGNLLGNLLCQVAGLLDNNGPATAIARLLNQILALLG